MSLYSVYLISIDGRPIVAEIFENHPNLFEKHLFCRLIATLQSKVYELIRNGIDIIRINDINYHLKYFEKFHVVIACELANLDRHTLDRIGRSFIKDYKKNFANWSGEEKEFTDFRVKIKDIIAKSTDFNFRNPIDPSKPLDTINIYQLPKALQRTALVMATLQMGTVREIARQLDEETDIVQGYLTILQQEGYVGVIDRGARSMYFAIS